MYYNSNFGGQVQQPMPQQMPMYGQGPYPVMDNRLSALEMQMKQGQQNPNLYGGRQQPQQMQVPTQQQFIKAIPAGQYDNCEVYRIRIAQSIPSTVTNLMPVVIEIGTSSTQYPVIRRCGHHLYANQVRTRRHYELKVAADTGLFVVVSSNLCTRNCGTVTHIPVTTTSSVAEA